MHGTAYVPSDTDRLKHWRLDYGAGRNPEQWTLIRESKTPITTDLFAQGRARWDPNTGSRGNMGMWEVGLAGYNYSSWRDNLNGIYTLRLSAESTAGEYSEIRVRVIIGEAIVRTLGGTSVSADGLFRISFQPFSFDAVTNSRVVAVIKQPSPPHMGLPFQFGPTDELATNAAPIYETIPDDLELASAIYRVYPNSLQCDPAFLVQIEAEAIPGSSQAFQATDAQIHQWNTVARKWVPQETTWAQNTANTTAHSLSEYESYWALLCRRAPIDPPQVNWHPQTILTGQWMGATDPHATIEIYIGRERIASGVADENGIFRINGKIRPHRHTYTVRSIPRTGTRFQSSTLLTLEGGPIVTPQLPKLQIAGSQEITADTPTYLICEDASLEDAAVTIKRSVLANVQSDDFSKRFVIEMQEVVPGSGRFFAKIDLLSNDTLSDDFKGIPHQTKLNVSVGASQVQLVVKDMEAPLIRLSSTTHPSLLYGSASTLEGEGLRSSLFHSQTDVQITPEGHWQLNAPRGKPSARITYWPINSVNLDTWPLIGFTYKSFNTENWQLHLNGIPRDGRISNSGSTSRNHYALNLGSSKPFLPEYGPSLPLRNDGKWNRWQANLSNGRLRMLNAINFGSFIQHGFHMADPGFSPHKRETLLIKNIWIGKSYRSPHIEMNWEILDASRLSAIQWWVNDSPESAEPEATDIQHSNTSPTRKQDGARFSVPSGGIWFFHIRVSDVAGNISEVFSFPLSVDAEPSTSPALAALTSLQNALSLNWEQPEGSLEIPLGNLVHQIDPAKVELFFNGDLYPAPKSVVDISRNMLIIRPESFKDAAPLGFDEETMTIELRSQNRQGQPVSGLPVLNVTTVSPFEYKDTALGGHISIRGANTTNNSWSAYWKDEHGPYHNLFKHSINNAVIVFPKYDTRDRRNIIRSVHWQRRIMLSTDEEPEQFWLEEMTSPTAELVPFKQARVANIFNYNGELASRRDGSTSADITSSHWAYKLDPFVAMNTGYVRIAIKERRRQLRIATIPLQQVSALIRDLDLGSVIRIDAWMKPNSRNIQFQVSNAASIEYAISGMSQFVDFSGRKITIESTDQWQRLTLLIRTDGKKTQIPRISINGPIHW